MTPDTDRLTPAKFAQPLERLLHVDRPRYQRLWAYYANPMRACGATGEGSSDRPYRQAQEWGLPARITGRAAGASDVFAAQLVDGAQRKEVVIENDIGWRVETMVDYLFGKPLVLTSGAPDPQRREMIGDLLRQILAHNGGILLFQQLALLGGVYGFVDVLVKLDACHATPGGACVEDLGQPPACDDDNTSDLAMSRDGANEPTPDGTGPSPGSDDHRRALMSPETASGLDDLHVNDEASAGPGTSLAPRSSLMERLARSIRLEIVEPARALPLIARDDWRVIEAYGHVIDDVEREDEPSSFFASSWMERVRRTASYLFAKPQAAGEGRVTSRSESAIVLEVITDSAWRRYRNGKIIASGANSLGQIPLVHIQNTAMPFNYSGASDVEPLIPLQDELNTRLSDRAHRITMQSFRMYLGKKIEDFDVKPVAPGRMWTSDDDQADIVEFGGDASCPSEDAHIADVREAMDKTSGVTPVAAGAIKGRIGRLTSAAALRVTMQSLLAKTEKKRTTYGSALARMCELALAWLDLAGLFHSTPEERRIEISWPSPLPENHLERLQEARHKLRLGVDREVVLRELGY